MIIINMLININFFMTSSTLDTNLHKILARRMAGGQVRIKETMKKVNYLIVILLGWRIGQVDLVIQGVFFFLTGTPHKNSKSKKVNLG